VIEERSELGTIDMAMTRPRVRAERLTSPSAVLLTLDRGPQRNPLDMGTLLELRAHLEAASSDSGLRAIVVTGEGPAFSSGGDLKAYEHLYAQPAEFRHFLDTFGQVCNLLESSAAVTIAMVNGACVAGGLELALACDFITMGDSAKIGDGHVKFAQLPGAGGSQRLVRAIGVQRAKDWLITGRLVDATEARDAGLVALVSSDENLLPDTLKLASSLEGTSPLTVGCMKQLVKTATRSTLEQGLATEKDTVFHYATTSTDAREGLRAFAERRTPNYLGR
jgi:enoyl-CoA hydratase/carnithine racemase